MMSLIKYEFIKVLQKKTLMIFLAFLCIINVVLFAYTQNLDTQIPPSAYQKLQNDIQPLHNEERLRFVRDKYDMYKGFFTIEQLIHLRMNQEKNQALIDDIMKDNPDVEEKYGKMYNENHQPNYTSHLESEVIFLEDIHQEFIKLSNYPVYIQNIQDKAQTIQTISIFQKEGFEQKNIEKTAQDYQGLINTPIVYESEKGISSVLSFPLTSIFILLAMMLLVSSMIFEEKENQLFSIIKTTPKGQYPTMIAKCSVMVIIITIMTTVMMVGLLLCSSMIYGLGDLSRSVQSLAHYYQCPYSLNVLQFIMLFIFIKCLAACFIGMLILLIAMISHHKIIAILGSVMIIVIEFALFLLIPSLSPFYLLKYFNVIAILQTDLFFQIYRNVSLFENPISMQFLIGAELSCLLVFITIANIIVYHFKRNMSIKQVEFSFRFFKQPSLSLFQQEFYKVFSIQKVLILILFVIVIQCYQYHDISIYQNLDEKIYQQYMKELEGPLTQEKEQWLLQEQKHYDDLNQQLLTLSQKEKQGLITHSQLVSMQIQIEQQQIGEPIFQEVYQQYLDILNDPQKEFVNPIAYQQYFIDTKWTFMPTMLLCLFVILSLSHIISYEYQNQVQRITQMTIRGEKHILNTKMFISIGISLILFLITTLPSFLLLQKTYGFSSLFSSVVSIEEFSFLPSWISIFMVCSLFFLLRFFAIMFMMVMIHAIAVKTKNYLLTIFIAITIFLIPLILTYGGYHFLDMISLYPLLFMGQYITSNETLLQILFSFIGYAFIAFVCLRYIYTHYKATIK